MKTMHKVGEIRVYASTPEEAKELAGKYHSGELDHDTLIKTIELPKPKPYYETRRRPCIEP